MTQLVKDIIAIEWDMFDKVQNRGGRASCQDNWTTFKIMRSSQLESWTEAMRESYLQDLKDAQAAGRNPLAEKYGYMMERTSPLEFLQIKDQLLPRSAEKDAMILKICDAQVAWLEAAAEKYPRLTGQGRSIHKEEDSKFNTSFETYLWGELATYSLNTIRLYDEYVAKLLQEGTNMYLMVLQNEVDQYGYASMEAAEARLAGK